eukprot:10197341-Alexandrium_andersonii.AAC.1
MTRPCLLQLARNVKAVSTHERSLNTCMSCGVATGQEKGDLRGPNRHSRRGRDDCYRRSLDAVRDA